MKLRFFCGLMTALIISTTSCKKDEDTTTTQVPQAKELKLESSTAQLSINGKTSIKITDGNGGYTAKSSDEKIVKASINNDVISIEAIKDGSTTVIVSDAKSKTATITVNVWKSIALDKKEVTLKKGEKSTITIQAGEGQYTIASQDANIASASISNNTITIEAIEKGETTITVTDSKSSQTETIKVVVELGFHLEKENITLKVGETQTIAVKNGSEQYLAKSNDENIALADWQAGVQVIGATVGTTKVIVTDNKTKEKLTLNVTVEASNLTLSTNTLNIDKNGGGTFQITHGSGFYTVKSNNTTIVEAEIKKDPTNYYYRVIVTDKKVGNTTLTITDTKTNKTATVNVIVVGTPLALSKESIILEKDASEHVTIFGNNDYSVKSNDNNIASATLEGNKVKITAIGAGNTTITVTDNGNSPAQTKTINVTVNAAITGDNNFVIDAEGTLTEVKNITPELVIPTNVKKIAGTVFSGNKTIEKITMESVVEIEASAFSSSTIREIIIGNKITTIGNGAFRTCTKLERITLKTSTPPTLGSGVFRSSNSNKILFVPKEAINAYKNNNNWSSVFKNNIKEIK